MVLDCVFTFFIYYVNWFTLLWGDIIMINHKLQSLEETRKIVLDSDEEYFRQHTQMIQRQLEEHGEIQ
jgi:hypothetical protein